MRAAVMGMDPWRVLDAGVDESLIAEALVEQLEANALAKVQVEASEIGLRVSEGILAILEIFGHVERKGGER